MPNPTPEQVDEVLERDARMRAALGDDLANKLVLHDRAVLAEEVKRLRAELAEAPAAGGMTAEDEGRIAELLAMPAALLQPEAIELRSEVQRLRAALAKRPKSRLGEQVNRLSNAVGDLERERDDARAELAAADKVAAGLRGELEDARRYLDQRRNDVFMWQQSYDHLAARTRRYRWAWQSAKRGRALARKRLRDLAIIAAQRDNFAEQMRALKAERDEAREQVKRVRARHWKQCSGACGLDDDCECEDRDLLCGECNERWPCGTIRDLDGTGDGRC